MSANGFPRTRAGAPPRRPSLVRASSRRASLVRASSRRLLLVAGALIALVLGAAVPASAHAALLRSDPAEGSVVKTAPASITLGFSEGVLLSDDSLIVYDPSGKQVQRGTAHHAGSAPDTATVALRPGLRDGTYTVAWKAVSADTHPVGGAWTFSIGAPSKTSAIPKEQQAGGGPAGALYGIARYVAYAGFALLVGACAFLTLCWPRGAGLRVMQRLTVGGWAALALATIALLLLRAPYVNGGGIGGIFDLGALRSSVETKEGAALVARLLLLAAAAVFLAVLFGPYARREDPEERRDLAFGLGAGGAVVAIGIAATWSAVEHASVGIQPALAMPLDVAHLIAMAFWLGGLVTLSVALYRAGAGGLVIDRAAVRRFSRIAFGCVCVLVATGVYQSWRQVGSWHALFGTSYGHWLIVKVSLVAVMVAAAGFSRRWTGRLAGRAEASQASASATSAATKSAATKSVVAKSSAKPAKPKAAKALAGTGGPASPADDPVRAAQLARQNAAVAGAAARKRRDADPARTGLRRSVLLEASVAVVVLAVSTVLSGSQPGRAVEEQAAATGGAGQAVPSNGGQVFAQLPFDTGGVKGKGDVGVHIEPARTGSNQLHLTVTDPVGNPENVPEVDLNLTLTSRGIGPLPVKLRQTGTGAWTAVGLQLPMPGAWQLAVTVRTSAIDEVTVTKNVAID
ncbi:copper resistance protein CopC [Streptomyces sp. PTM05]|uniref:Copper resistance protein CopC n=1 Tax=Streptantibioticus parmotrematis TaxID=2873249 RepID=A0ABS7QUA9_9ACTN|nr:copper resistance protein CopC [Streptantibioticus parmotrematis]MBY8886798.1 copper resistance protein CopC [Streptantibioticus parmotrematis]